MIVQHTPVPWKARPSDLNTARIWITQGAPNGTKSVPLIAQVSEGNPQHNANAEFIVLACNGHCDLLEACRAALERLDAANACRTEAQGLFATDDLHAAIAKATGGQP